MLEKIRYRIATHLVKKAIDQIDMGNVLRGLKYFKMSIWIVPPSKELSEFGERFRQTIEIHSQKLRLLENNMKRS